jgi:PelA/Pel-15E family pectate lyase
MSDAVCRPIVIFTLVCASLAKTVAAEPVAWKNCLSQPAAWYAGDEATRIADNVLVYQRATGGWPKNLDFAQPLTDKTRADAVSKKNRRDSTIDNSATTTQLVFLARVYRATKQDRFRTAFEQGLSALLAAQYENGGWPQTFPDPRDYHAHITFNDNAMINVLALLRDIARGKPEYDFVPADRRERAKQAAERGISCILKCQVVLEGKPTAWCAQHDAKTLKPAPARSYEHASLSGSESVQIVWFLMEIDQPSPDVVAAIDGAVAWFERARLSGIRVEKTGSGSGRDVIVRADPAAPPVWARFYDLTTNKPIFSGRDGVIKQELSEIEQERRVGYAWYTTAPAKLIEKDYPAWKAAQRQRSDKRN